MPPVIHTKMISVCRCSKAKCLLNPVSLVLIAGLTGIFFYAHATESLKTRSFEFTYSATIKNIPYGAKELDVWIPYPQSSSCQKIDDVRFYPDGPLNIERDPDYKNAFIHIKKMQPLSSVINFKMSLKATRTEKKAGFVVLGDAERELSLKPNELVTINPCIKEMALNATKDKKTTPEKAKALYDFVLNYMSYDKTGEGWGRGDTEYACMEKKGNCTDFHSLFISLARAVGIPAKFEIGFLLPRDKQEGAIGGYHCWAEFYAEGIGWVPVDISEAWKDRAKADYFFGTFCENRIQFTQGRDIVLESNKDEKTLNFFIYPYAEVEGKRFDDIEMKLEFKNL